MHVEFCGVWFTGSDSKDGGTVLGLLDLGLRRDVDRLSTDVGLEMAEEHERVLVPTVYGSTGRFDSGVCLQRCTPRASAGFLASRGEIWRALLDNAAHACIAAASWAVVVAISPSPSFSSMAAPGSPLHRCVSCTILRARGRLRAIGLSLRRQSTVDSSSISLGRGDLQGSPPDGELGNAPSARDRVASAREIACVACFASLLDVDHFLAAGSLRLANATSLTERPWGHCLAFLVLATFMASVLTHNKRVAASVLLAGASHQLRDATRRGLWLYAPRGPKTHPLGYPLYLLVQALLPIAVALCLTRSVGSWFRRYPEGEDRGAQGRRRCSLFDVSRGSLHLYPTGGEEDGDRGSLVEAAP